jgi:tRNA/tmRNA/rRNA uracil-C5-methylase (TrmA/RlmC/RlmD family)
MSKRPKGYDRAMYVEICRQKVWYQKHREANLAAQEWLRRKKPAFVYRCHICDLYHLSSDRMSDRKRKQLKDLEKEWREKQSANAGTRVEGGENG